MDKQKQIEEMASVLIGSVVTGADSTKVLNIGYITAKELASILINAGYRKIPENAELQKQVDELKFYQEILIILLDNREKDTAKEILKWFESRYPKLSVKEYFAQRYGVEVE